MRYATPVESAADLGAGAAIALLSPPGKAISLRRLVVGGRGASSPGQVTAAVAYAETPGTPSGSASFGQPISTGQFLGDNSAQGTAFGEFSADPVHGSNPLYLLSLNSQGGSESLTWGFGEFVAHIEAPIMLYTVNAVPSGYLYTVSFEFEIL